METTSKENQSDHSRFPISQLHPWLIICHGKSSQRQTFFSISDNRFYPRVIPDMRSKTICTSSHGWLVLEDNDSKNCFLWNPMTMEKLELPSLSNVYYNFCILSAPPSDPNCCVMFLTTSEHFLVLCQPGDHEFVQKEFELEESVQNEFEEKFLVCATVFEGKIYGLMGPSYKLVVADFSGPTFKFRQVLDGIPKLLPTSYFSTSYLVDDCGELLLIHKSYLGSQSTEALSKKKQPIEVDYFKLFRLDFTKMALNEVKSLGNRTLFLDLSCRGMSCFSEEAGIKGNCIYYIESDRNINIYDLEDQSMAITLPCPHVSRYNCSLQWIVI